MVVSFSVGESKRVTVVLYVPSLLINNVPFPSLVVSIGNVIGKTLLMEHVTLKPLASRMYSITGEVSGLARRRRKKCIYEYGYLLKYQKRVYTFT